MDTAFKAYRLFKKDGNVAKNGKVSIWLILPSANLREIVAKQYKKKYPEINYRVDWKDVNGYGIQLTHCDWVHAGFYHSK